MNTVVLFQTSKNEAKIEKTSEVMEVSEKSIAKSEMTVTSEVVDEDRHRSANRETKNLMIRARSFESDEERKALLTLRRSQSLKRRDGSWDKKWEDERQAEVSSRSRPWTKPGRLNNSYWEKRVKAEHALPPRTPPPKRKLRGILDGRISPSNRLAVIK